MQRVIYYISRRREIYCGHVRLCVCVSQACTIARTPVADLRGGGVAGVRPLNMSQTAVKKLKMVCKQFAGSSRIKNWINDNQQLLVNSLINKTIHVSQYAKLIVTSLLDITLLHFA